MSLQDIIKALINQRLAVVAEEICLAVEKVIVEDFHYKQRIEDQHMIVELVLNEDTGWFHCS